jgi:hypothetical protein
MNGKEGGGRINILIHRSGKVYSSYSGRYSLSHTIDWSNGPLIAPQAYGLCPPEEYYPRHGNTDAC